MRYEGYEQHICEHGHYFENRDIYRMDDEPVLCPQCMGKSAWFNSVNETNGPTQGEIPMKELEERFLLCPARKERCNLGHEHEVESSIFRIPSREQTNKFRKHYEE